MNLKENLNWYGKTLRPNSVLVSNLWSKWQQLIYIYILGKKSLIIKFNKKIIIIFPSLTQNNSTLLGVSRPNYDLPDWPTRPISTRVHLEPMLPSVGFGFPRPRPDAGGSSGKFSSPKPEPPDPTEVIYKYEIKLKYEEIQWVLNHIWWDLARSGHSHQISTILVQILAILMQI